MQLPAQLFRRRKDSHKGDFGHIFIVGGSRSMAGAAILAGKAALRSGAGLVTIGIPESVATSIPTNTVELMTLPLPETNKGTIAISALESFSEFVRKVDVLLIGPGLSNNPQTQNFIRRAIAESRLQTIIDADAINAWPEFMDSFKVEVSCLSVDKCHLKIITPHPGEMAKLLGVTVSEVQKNRVHMAKSFAKEYNVIVVLKGYQTVVADPNGTIYVNKTGNSGMSTAGTGDVLSGMISAFLAQGLSSFNAAKFGVYIHGLAGDLVVNDKTELGLIASDIIEYIPKAFMQSIPIEKGR